MGKKRKKRVDFRDLDRERKGGERCHVDKAKRGGKGVSTGVLKIFFIKKMDKTCHLEKI